MSRNLVISTVGKQNCVNLWKNGKYDVVLIDYTKYYKPKKESARVKRLGKLGNKYPIIKWYNSKYGIKYDKIIMIDDDIVVTPEQIEKMFEYLDEFPIVHPAIREINNDLKVMYPDDMTELRLTNWTEISCVGMTKRIFDKLVGTFDESQWGYGFPELWRKLTGTNFAILDSIPVIHSLPTNRGKDSAVKEYERRMQMKALFETYGLKNTDVREIGRRARNNISFVTIYSEDRKRELLKMIDSLPPQSEIILVETIQSDEKNGIQEIEKRNNGIVTAKWYYKKFNYSHARNAAKTLATRPIIFSIDSDEFLNPMQHNELLEECCKLEKAEYMGLHVRLVNLNPNKLDENGMLKSYIHGRVLIFKNIKELYWKSAIHECIDTRIGEVGGRYKDSNIILIHTGYDLTDEEKIAKMYKRLEIADNFPDDFKDGYGKKILKREYASLYALEKHIGKTDI